MVPHWETSESMAKLFYKAASMYVRFPLGIRVECQLQNHARAGTVQCTTQLIQCLPRWQQKLWDTL